MMVVKIGGAVGTGFENLVEDLKDMDDLILVHGGSHEMNILSERLDNPPRFVTSPSGHVSRFTDRDTLENLMMAYSGKVNKTMVETMRLNGINALGLTGMDGGLLKGKKKDTIRIVENGKKKVLRGDNTGRVGHVNTGLLRLLADNGYVPVITIPIEATVGGALNADADRAAAAVASAMEADTLVILSNVPGLLRDMNNPDSLIPTIPKNHIEEHMEFAQGRMKKKVLGVREAIDGGVARVILASANVDRPLSRALKGEGTVIS